ncbi:hypothetical protein [uncultured Clostridium sp.]|uniref:hypothetical protein n=1 Tax=uncultured Clostridium sp. TaxID=59620 RepID=UPI0025D14DA1|nr:hypothetical protein [uncultured Clostridium sp.]
MGNKNNVYVDKSKIMVQLLVWIITLAVTAVFAGIGIIPVWIFLIVLFFPMIKKVFSFLIVTIVFLLIIFTLIVLSPLIIVIGLILYAIECMTK